MADLEKRKQNTKRTEQLVIERFFKVHIPECWSFASDCKIYADDNWFDIISKYQTYKLRDLLKEGYRIVSLNKVLSSEKDKQNYGIETAILEREVE